MPAKPCSKCGHVKPLTEYDRSGRSGKMSFCKACRRKMRNASYVPHPRPRLTVEPGQRFGRLTALAGPSARTNGRFIVCVCDCGTQADLRLYSLIKGETASCGCYHRELRIERNRTAEQRAHIITHGMTRHPLYSTWRGMIDRCENQQHHAYRNYGGRGIKVCLEWHDPAAFITWIEANIGSRPEGRTLDRVNNNGHYEPGNMRWATRSEQRRNRRLA